VWRCRRGGLRAPVARCGAVGAALAALVSLGACGETTGGDDDVPADAAPGDPSRRVGTFAIDLVAAREENPAHTSIVGVVYDREPPVAVGWNDVVVRGDCRLRTPSVPFCSVPCGPSAVCVAAETCAPYASKRAAGRVQLSGLATSSGRPIDLVAIGNTYQLGADVTLAYPPFAPGAPVELMADGAGGADGVEGFYIIAAGVAPLALTSADPVLERDVSVVLTYGPGAAGATTRLIVELDISHHGGTRGEITCDAADTGSVTIDGALITGLLDLGVAGFPTIIVERRSRGSTVIGAGRIDLDVRSQVERPVTIPGLQSCTDSSQCPPGEVCRDDLTCG
jgi:hypothetical protein